MDLNKNITNNIVKLKSFEWYIKSIGMKKTEQDQVTNIISDVIKRMDLETDENDQIIIFAFVKNANHLVKWASRYINFNDDIDLEITNKLTPDELAIMNKLRLTYYNYYMEDILKNLD